MGKLKVGDKVTVRQDIYLGNWLMAGGEGVIVAIGDNEGQPLYHVEVKGVQYTFVDGELLEEHKDV